MTIILKAQSREETGKKVKTLRQQRFIPAVLYGHKVANKNLTLSANEFDNILKKAGTSTLVDLQINEETPVKIIIADIQRDPVYHTVSHADLHQINMAEEITANVSLNFIGESPAIKHLGGVLLKSLDRVEVKCLPSDLPHEITVDLQKLTAIDSHIAIKDLAVSPKVKITNKADDFVALIKAVKVEEELIVSEAEALNKIEVAGVKKEEGVESGEVGKEGENGEKGKKKK